MIVVAMLCDGIHSGHVLYGEGTKYTNINVIVVNDKVPHGRNQRQISYEATQAGLRFERA